MVRPEPEPSVERRSPATASHKPLPDESVQISGVRILVVDDEPDSRDLLRRVLEECRATVTTSSSAREALRTIQASRQDLIISDIGMPGEDGYSLIQQIRSMPEERGGTTPAIALTAYARAEDRMKVMSAGFQHHLSKPVESAELIEGVASLMRSANDKR